jgi:ornithine cyclodeaminase/alanine dehydrogenase-like protein (mu-crystallin family)
MTSGEPLLILSDADIAGLEIDVRSVRTAVHDAFRLYSEGKLRCENKTSLALGPGHAFQSLVAVDTQRNYAGLKWVGMVPPGGAAKVNINASLLLSDVQTGQLRCLMDARRATAFRTAGMTAAAAEYLARKDSVSIGFVGAGVQAESHLLALADLLPSLRNVYVNSEPLSSAQRFVQRSQENGFEAVACSAQEAVSRSDVVITTVPLVPGLVPFNDAAWLRPGAFVAAIDLGRSWKHAGLSEVDMTIVDEEAMKHYAKPGNFIPPLEYAQATLADLAGGRHKGRASADQRIMLFSSGSAVADLAIAMLIYESAMAKGVGTHLAL